MNNPLRILLLEDNEYDFALVIRTIRKGGIVLEQKSGKSILKPLMSLTLTLFYQTTTFLNLILLKLYIYLGTNIKAINLLY